MYNDFFGLNRNPFELSPDPSFMCSTEKSNEALASIMYAIANRKGFVVMTGDVGTGKTLIVRSLFEWWKSQGIAFANIFAPKLPVLDFLINATSDLGIKVTESTKGNLLRAFYGFLVTQFQKGLTTVLVIDEAHQMPTSVLEEIRMLTNVETNQQKLVQVLLVGQPELDAKLDSFELRQLKQRIAIRCRLEPLTEEETRNYIKRRLNLAGGNAQANAIFPAETVDVVHHYSRGIPRLINSVCDHALVAVYTLQLRVVPVGIIEEVASRFRLDPAPDPKQTEKPLSLADQTEKSVPDEFWRAVPSLKVSATKAPDPDASLRHGNAGNGTPVQTPSPSNAETSYGRSLCDIHGVLLQAEQADPTPYKSKLNIYREMNRVTAPSKARPLESTQASTRATESVLRDPEATQLKACGPAIDQTAASVPNPRAISRSGKILRQIWPSQLCHRSAPMLRSSRLICAAVVVALATAVIMARRQNGAVVVPPQVATAWKPSPVGPIAVPMQPAETNSASQLSAGSVRSIMPRHDREISESTGALEDLPSRTKTVIGTLSQPVLKSPHLSTFSEPPLIVGTQANELLGNGLSGISVPGPTPPAASAGGNLQPPKLVSSPPLASSSLALTGKMEGVVVIDALVDDAGKVTDMKVISGFPRLTQAAMDALRTWKYEPARLNGQPIAMHMKVSINFSLQ
jgi:TonB family protein